ncbi:FtsX-like permease family protein [Microbacterium sp. MTN4-26]|uniref:FtsX-like permease family protein n=1 Tax=unclassified Microbacterium TaxID=2609290 RepID=UPI0036F39F39
MGAVALTVRHLRSHGAGGGIVVALLVVVLAFLATAAPMLLAILADLTIRDRLDRLPPTQTDVVSETVGYPLSILDSPAEPWTTEQVWGPFASAVEQIRDEAGSPVPAILQPARMVTRNLDNPIAGSGRTQSLTVAFDPAYEAEIELIEGRLPVAAAGFASSAWPPLPAGVANRIEVVISRDTARELSWGIDETRVVGTAPAVELVLVGVFEAAEPTADYWQHVTSVLSPQIIDDGNEPRRVTGTAFAHPASLVTCCLTGRGTTLAWYPLVADEVTGRNAAATASSLRSFTAVSHPTGDDGAGYGAEQIRFDAPILPELDAARAQVTAMVGVLAMIIAGPAGAGAAVLLLGCRAIIEGRRRSLRLLSARGASRSQVRAVAGIDGTIVGVAPAALGAAAALALASALRVETVQPVWFLAALLIGAAPPILLAVMAPSVAKPRTRTDIQARGTRARVVVDVLVAFLAVLALTLLLLRGYSVGVDVLLAATPLLLALAACLVTLRLYPIPLSGLYRWARRRPGLDSFLGAARAMREPSLGLIPVLALVVGVSVAVLSGVLLSILQSGATEASRAQVGSDMRVTGGVFVGDVLGAVQDVDGVAAMAAISGAEPVTIASGEDEGATMVFVVDAGTVRAVQGEGPGLLPPKVSLGSAATGDVTIVASASAARTIEDSTDTSLNGVPVRIVGVVDGPVPIGTRQNWVAVDVSAAEQILGGVPVARTLLLSLEPNAAAVNVADGVREVLGDAVQIDTADEINAQTASAPAVQGVRIALLLATGLSAVLSSLALVLTLTLGTPTRVRLVALLRTLGASRRAMRSVAAWEVGPPAVAAVVVGAAFGAVVPLVVMAAVDLRPFTGSTISPSYALDLGILGLTLVGFVGLVATLTTIALLVARRARLTSALRSVEEG